MRPHPPLNKEEFPLCYSVQPLSKLPKEETHYERMPIKNSLQGFALFTIQIFNKWLGISLKLF